MIDHKLFKYYLEYFSPTDMYKNLNKTTGTEKNKTQVNMMKANLTNLMVEIINCILYFNHLNQEVLWLKILTPSQMLSRLPISFAQLNAGNNSEKLKNEIRQILYSLCGSKKLTKKI